MYIYRGERTQGNRLFVVKIFKEVKAGTVFNAFPMRWFLKNTQCP